MTQPCLLAFDTSGPWCAAAVMRGDSILASRMETMARGQAERLMPLLAETLAEAAVALDDLAALAVGIGPGNFTGIRLAVSAARGLALARGLPAIGVSSLEALAEGQPRPVLAVLDARRGAVYAQRFDPGHDGAPGLIADPATLPGCLPRIGDVAGAVSPDTPIAERIARVALTRIGTAPARPAPLYLRAADAAPPRDPAPAILP